MKKLNMEIALKKYNDLMYDLCREHNTIGQPLSENTSEWNLRDMVAECDYELSTYYEGGHCNEEMRYSDDPEVRKMWRSEVGKLSRFIKRYEPFIENMICAEGHCSKYDN
jgi:hypothetical protein